jgi:predicted pyridoxine 5'-phosphate oxidase superfamily flavin-nucleotide-binding protein
VTADGAPVSLADVRRCFEGAVPAVIATASADGTPNVTYLSRVQLVDDERVALSNQFFSKTARNLAENHRASVLLIDPTTYDEYRLTLAYERTERRGPVFERLREDIVALAALEGMGSVFKLRAADIYRVAHIERTLAAHPVVPRRARPAPGPRVLADLLARLGRAPDLDTLVSCTVAGLAEVLGYEHSMLLLLDETGTTLFTIASHGYDAEGVGSEVLVGEGIVGTVAAQALPMRVGNLRQMKKYSRTVRRSYEDSGELEASTIPMPELPRVQSRIAVPAMAYGQLVGVLVAESEDQVAFDDEDLATLEAVAGVVAYAVEAARAPEAGGDQVGPGPAGPAAPGGPPAHLRFFPADGSTFLDGEYLIKGVAGRILWSLVRHHEADGRVEFTNRELRLDPTLELPPFRDNLESRLLLLKRRLDERQAPVTIERIGRGRFRLDVTRPVRLDEAGGPAPA